jgi:hypothetical protein
MKGDFPFTDYDFWAYISAGFVFLFALDHVAQTGLMIRPAWTVVEGLLAVACAYATGQILAGFASALLERRLVQKLLGTPSMTLFDTSVGPRWFRWLYPSFYEPLPKETRNAILKRAAERGVDAPGEALFWIAFDVAKANTAAMARMSSFLNQYGMCRNLSLTLFVCAAMLAGAAYHLNRSDDYWWAAGALLLGCGMFLRYLKFYRHYSVEVFTTYAHARP